VTKTTEACLMKLTKKVLIARLTHAISDRNEHAKRSGELHQVNIGLKHERDKLALNLGDITRDRDLFKEMVRRLLFR